uniref:Uncharacterized protein n=1 Tax=Aegilops tauschii subsp. strangulata TaxID=200361 RepID=A0A453EDK1_AEGTS
MKGKPVTDDLVLLRDFVVCNCELSIAYNFVNKEVYLIKCHVYKFKSDCTLR